jgi:ATP-binding cassette subfamily F protein uup
VELLAKSFERLGLRLAPELLKVIDVAPRNLINLESVSKSYGKDPVLQGISLGVGEGERIGIVGRNGGGKSTLLRVMAGVENADSGRVTSGGSVRIGILAQEDQSGQYETVRDFVLGDRATHEWATDARIREVFTALFGSHDQSVFERKIAPLSGGEKRRASLARLLIADLDLLLLDEPTNHLDVEAVAWLATHLRSRRNLAVAVITHDRWFLDEVSDRTWEVIRGGVEEYDGGYSAYVLAKAERMRQAATEDARRKNLIRKELAWLRRGPPARTTKPKFRIDAANQLISDEPPPRNEGELLSFAGARLGKTVYETHDATLGLGGRNLVDHLTWNVGPGDRIGIVGINGSGKTSLLRMLMGEIKPTAGRITTGITVQIGYLSQHLDELNPKWRLLEAVEDIAMRVDLGKGRELSASQLCERLGFGPDAQWTPVGDLSGGERRRLQLTRIFMRGPNVLLLDEPTNDFDVETLSALEDLLDDFIGTLLVVSHDRYFLERVCDRFVGMLGDGAVRDLPRGVDEYLELRSASPFQPVGGVTSAKMSSAADLRILRKEVARLERAMEKVDEKERALHERLAAEASDFAKVAQLDAELGALIASKEELEAAWLIAVAQVEG